LKRCQKALVATRRVCRAPRGARGLKLQQADTQPGCTASRPARGAWIETGYGTKATLGMPVAPRAGRVD